MSNDISGENPELRMPKVSAPTFVVCGLGDPKVRPIGVADGLLVNIPVLGNNHLTWGGTELDTLREDVNSSSKQQSSLCRQIHRGVYLSCE